MKCTVCSAEILADGKFCQECGTTVALLVPCKFSCGEMNPPDADFCPGCGKSQKSDLPSVANPASAPLSKAIGSDFTYLLDEDSYRDVSSMNIEVPYGAVGVTMVDGKVEGVRQQQNYDGNKKNSIKDFLTGLYEAGIGLLGQRKQDIKTYVLLDLQGLAIVSHIQPIPTPGALDASLRFDFWIESHGDKTSPEQLKNIGLFFERCVGKKRALTLNDFKNLAIANIPNLISSMDPQSLTTAAGLDQLRARLLQATGISSRCTYTRGRQMQRRYLEVSKFQKPVSCSNSDCGAQYTARLKFCEECGTDLSNSDWVKGALFLQAETGEEITLRLNLLQDADKGVIPKTDEQIAEVVIQHLNPVLRRRSVASLMESSVLAELGTALNANLMRDFEGYISDIKVVDIRTASEEWFFKTEALINEELRKIETDTRFLVVEDGKTDYLEAAFSVALRRIKQGDTEELTLRKTALEAKMKMSELEIEKHALNTKTDLRKESIDDVAARERMVRDRELNRDRVSGDREDEISEVDHRLNLDVKVATHDINMADLTGEAESRSKRRDISDTSFEQEEALRLDAERKKQLGHIDEDLKDREAKRNNEGLDLIMQRQAALAKQELDFELSKTQTMKGMSPAEILAMQAAQLVKSGGSGAAADIVKAIADSQAAASGASIKDELYDKMLKIQENASQMAVDAHKSAADSALKSSENMAKVAGAAASNSNEGYKEAAKIAQTTNEKSMESMAKVATATAGRKTGKDEKDASGDEWDCVECGKVSITKPGKFSTTCGHKRPLED